MKLPKIGLFIYRVVMVFILFWFASSLITGWLAWNDHIQRRENCSQLCHPLQPRMLEVDRHITDGEQCFCETKKGFLRIP
jgi:hypothetical protein